MASCGSQKQLNNREEAYKIINQISDEDFILLEDSYYKSKNRKNLPAYLNKGYFIMLVSYQMDVLPNAIKAKFSEKDFEYMQQQAKQNGSIKWKEKYLKDRIKVQRRPIVDRNKKVLRLSYPVFSLDKKYAVVFVESSTSGNLTILKKTNGKWKVIGGVLLWIS